MADCPIPSAAEKQTAKALHSIDDLAASARSQKELAEIKARLYHEMGCAFYARELSLAFKELTVANGS